MVAGVAGGVTNGLTQLQRHLAARSLRMWLLVRASFALALLMTLNPPLPVGGLIAFAVVVVSITVSVLDTHRVKEMVLLANLGLRFWALIAMLAVLPLLGEILLVAVL